MGHENSPVGCGGVENLQGGVETIFEVVGHYISLSLSHLEVSMPFDA